MRSPGFWWRPRPTAAALALAPLGAVYGAATARRMARPGQRAAVPVLCVGNFVAGGAGKTPAALALARLLQDDGHHPAILSRGYGRAPSAPPILAVDPARHTAREAGDEPLLLARAAPTLVGADRIRTAAMAVAGGADCLILDDGLQNPTLRKSWTLAIVDGAVGVGNGLCVPAGPLRAPLRRQWPAVSMLLVVGDGEPGLRLAETAVERGIAAMGAWLEPDPGALERLRGASLFAFAGIGRPEKFFATLHTEGLDVVGTRAFPDHHAYGAADLASLVAAAGAMGARLVTTEKDRVRLPAEAPVDTLPVRLAVDDPIRLAAAVRLSF